VKKRSQSGIKEGSEMNILFFANESRMGGANLSLLGLIDELKGSCRVAVVVPIKNGYMVEELKKREVPVYYRHSFWWMLAPAGSRTGTFFKKLVYKVLCLNNYLCALSLLGIVKRRKIDVIHTNSSVLNTGGILAAMTGVPHVWHLREFGQEDFGFFSVWKYDKLCRFIDTRSDRVLAISRAIAQKFQDKISSQKLEIVYNGVGKENVYDKTAVERPRGVVEFLIGGRISREKGQEDAIKAVGLAVRNGHRNLHLSIAGPGKADYLEKLISKEQLGDYVSLLGTVNDMPSLRKRMDIELVCSVCEGFGRVTIEAMMSSNAVIGSNTGGTPELIRDGYNGYLYQQGNIQELADKIICFLEHPEEIERMGRNAYLFATEKFTRKRNAERIVEIYRELII